MTMDGKLKIKIDYTVDDSVVEGDYFTVDFGKYIHPGTSRKPYRVNNIHDANGRTIAIDHMIVQRILRNIPSQIMWIFIIM